MNHPAPSPEGIRRIYNDARIWINVSKDRDIPAGEPIDVSELIEQLKEEGYTKSEAKEIIDAYVERNVLEHDFDGVRPVRSEQEK